MPEAHPATNSEILSLVPGPINKLKVRFGFARVAGRDIVNRFVESEYIPPTDKQVSYTRARIAREAIEATGLDCPPELDSIIQHCGNTDEFPVIKAEAA